MLDAGIASKENVTWLESQEKEYKYLVVSRKRTLPPMDLEKAEMITDRDGEPEIHVERVINDRAVKWSCTATHRNGRRRIGPLKS